MIGSVLRLARLLIVANLVNLLIVVAWRVMREALVVVVVVFAVVFAVLAYASSDKATVITEWVKLVIARATLRISVVADLANLANLLIVVNLVYLVVSGRAGAAVAGAAGKRQFAELMIVLRAWGAGIE